MDNGLNTPKYMEWYMQNTIMLLFVAEQLNDSRTTITHNVTRTTVEETHFSVPRVHQNFGQTRESVNAANPKWMTNLFGVDLNTPNFVASYLASLQ